MVLCASAWDIGDGDDDGDFVDDGKQMKLSLYVPERFPPPEDVSAPSFGTCKVLESLLSRRLR